MSNMTDLVDKTLTDIGDELDLLYKAFDDIQGMLPDKDDKIDPEDAESIALYMGKAMNGKKEALKAMAYMEKHKLC